MCVFSFPYLHPTEIKAESVQTEGSDQTWGKIKEIEKEGTISSAPETKRGGRERERGRRKTNFIRQEDSEGKKKNRATGSFTRRDVKSREFIDGSDKSDWE